MAPGAHSCSACGKTGAEHCCVLCKNAWFCGRKCRVRAVKKLGHKGAKCRSADGAQTSSAKPDAEATGEAPEGLERQYHVLVNEAARKARGANSRAGFTAALETYQEAGALAHNWRFPRSLPSL